MANRHEVKVKKVVPAPNEYNTRQMTNKGQRHTEGDISPSTCHQSSTSLQ